MKVKDRYIGMWFQINGVLYFNDDQNQIIQIGDVDQEVELDPELEIHLDVTALYE